MTPAELEIWAEFARIGDGLRRLAERMGIPLDAETDPEDGDEQGEL